MSIQMRNKTSGTLEQVAGFNDVDQILSATSDHPIANKSVYNALAHKIEKTVDDLVNYYDNSQVYNKAEVRQLIGAINTLTIAVVSTLPTSDISSTTIYFVGPATGTTTYDEYIYINNTWIKIGDTDIDLSGYVTSDVLTTALQSYYTKTGIDAILEHYYNSAQVDTLLNTKQNTLTFDNAPTQSSNNPVKSGGIYNAIADAVAAKQDKEFIGTTAQWEALSSTDKAKYTVVNLTDDVDYAGAVTDSVALNNSKAVSSNGVALKFADKFKSITHDIETGTTAQSLSYPTGFNGSNCVLIAAKIWTRYDSWVDITYNMDTAGTSSYWGSVLYQSNSFTYRPFVSDAAQKITFFFMKYD